MVVHDRAGRFVLGVVQSLLIRRQAYAAVAGARKHIGKVFATAYMHQVDGLFVSPAFTHSVDEERTIFRNVANVN